MSKLIVCNQEGEAESEYILDKERFIIGRKSTNDISLPHTTVSAEHALIITIRNDSFLEDLNSTNGIRVNNLAVKKCVLQNGDEIKIGNFRLKYIYEELPEPLKEAKNNLSWLMDSDTVVVDRSALNNKAGGEPDLSTTHKIPHESDHLPAPKEQESSSTQASGAKAVIRMLSGPGAGKELELVKMLTTIGKPGLQVAVITRRSKGYFLTHIEGGDFPLVNAAPVGPHSYELKNHDIIELADTKMEFFIEITL